MENDLIKPGTILVSKPTLSMDVFSRSIVLITEYNEMGTIGFVLNKPTSFKVEDLLDQMPLENTIYEGGPVELENLFYLHSFHGIKDSIKIKENLYWSGSLDHIYNKLDTHIYKSINIKFFIGYSSWSPGQLDEEINNNFWSIINDYDFNPLDINEVNDWKKQMKKLGGDNVLWANMPENPLLN